MRFRPVKERLEINQFLGRRGLATLDDPRGLVTQVAFLIQNHDHLRSMLIRCEPEHRRDMYESLKPHLRFEAKPLDVYIAEGQADAERRQLPTLGPNGELVPFKPAEIHTQAEAEENTPESHVTAVLCGACGKVYDVVASGGACPHCAAAPAARDLETAQTVVDEAFARKTLMLVCRKCTREQSFPGALRTDCWVRAREAGWQYVSDGQGGYEVCPNCQ